MVLTDTTPHEGVPNGSGAPVSSDGEARSRDRREEPVEKRTQGNQTQQDDEASLRYVLDTLLQRDSDTSTLA